MLFDELLGNGEAFGLRGTIVIDGHREHKRTRWFEHDAEAPKGQVLARAMSGPGIFRGISAQKNRHCRENRTLMGGRHVRELRGLTVGEAYMRFERRNQLTSVSAKDSFSTS